jgi:bifunctional non-homologous end joining protein LigD
VHDELVTLGLNSVPKTSGASGIHIVVPLPGDTPAVAARLIAELVATQVAARHRAAATVARSVRERGVEQVYVDYLQNIPGKSVASVYSARATPTLTVSTPLHWAEVNAKLDPRDFTIRTLPERLVAEGDLWADAMACGNDLEALRRTLGGARGPKR